MNKNIADIRKDYSLLSLDESNIAANPFQQFSRWWNEAVNTEINEVNAMTLSTSTKQGKPSARIVLLKDFDENGFVFFTNYESNKGKELSENPCCPNFFSGKKLSVRLELKELLKKLKLQKAMLIFFQGLKAVA